MKVAVATITTSTSPGAIYQAFALCSFLERLGNTIIVLPNLMPELRAIDKYYSIKSISKIFKWRFRGKKYCADTIFFIPNRFICKTSLSPDDNVDLLIVGSDQTFNSKLVGDHFFFKSIKDIKKVTFSSSFGSLTQEEASNDIFDLLKDFQMLSFREDPTYLNLPPSLNYQCHLDPTFLLTRDDWLALLEKYTKRKKEYILLFGVSENRNTLKFAQKIAKNENIELIVTNYWGLNPLFGVKIVNYNDPFALLALIRDAKYVVTHSYHGYIMSINLNVKVYYYLASYWNNSNYRFVQVKKVLELPDWEVGSCNDYKKCQLYEWDGINKRIERERQRSQEYLKGVTIFDKMQLPSR